MCFNIATLLAVHEIGCFLGVWVDFVGWFASEAQICLFYRTGKLRDCLLYFSWYSFSIFFDFRGMTVTSGVVTLAKENNFVGISIGGGAPLCPCLYIAQVLSCKIF